MSSDQFLVKFWGVRGSMPTPGTSTIRYGGQTSCVEVRCGDNLILFDAGTGIYPFGESTKQTDMDIFLSHTHIDHICGFPFFSPAYKAGHTIRMWAGHLLPENRTLKETVSTLMSPPLFPLTLDDLKADVSFHDFAAGESPACEHLHERGIGIKTMELNHPDRATAYRISYKGRSVCYVTDVEHTRNGLDQDLITFIRDSDLFIYDSTYDDREFDNYVGWGHSTWQEATRLATAANVEALILFHHDHDSTDDELDQRSEELKAIRPNDRLAREGLVIKLF
ncbi:MAG: MBL fold metallo-hydrolase [Rickettsiales bacterium]|nr:MBL fold metallo-hydrolase [Rickettsiales bacterium]